MKAWTFFDFDNTMHHSYGLRFRTGYSSNHSYRASDEQVPAINALPTRMIVALGGEESDVERIGAALENCIVAPPLSTQGQHHFLPLTLWPGVLSWYHANQHSWQAPEPKDLPLGAPRIYVEGKLFDFEAKCRACPFYMEKALDLCRPLHSSCRLEEAPFYVGKPHELLIGWLRAHPMRDDKIPADFTYKLAKYMTTRDAFEKLSLASLTSDTKELGEHHEVLSAKSKAAALTQRYTKFVCVGCLREKISGSYCSSRGGSRCGSGPYLEADFKHWAEKCEPWVVHAMMLGQKTFDARKYVPGWGCDRTKDHTVICGSSTPKYGGERSKRWPNTTRWVDVYKDCRRSFGLGTIPYELACRQVHEKPVESWQALARRGYWFTRGGVPDWVKALAYLLYDRRGRSINSPGGWGEGGQYSLVRVKVDGHEFCLKYRTESDCRSCKIVGSLKDLFWLNKVEFSEAVLTSTRKIDNDILKKLVTEDRVNVTGAHWRELQQGPFKGRLPEVKELRKILAKERREAKARLETENKKAARAAARRLAQEKKRDAKLAAEEAKNELDSALETPVGVVTGALS